MFGKFDLRRKRVIALENAEAVGYISDMDIDIASGKINSVTIPKKGIAGIFAAAKNVTVPWESVVAIGSEFVIIKQKESNKTRVEK